MSNDESDNSSDKIADGRERMEVISFNEEREGKSARGESWSDADCDTMLISARKRDRSYRLANSGVLSIRWSDTRIFLLRNWVFNEFGLR